MTGTIEPVVVAVEVRRLAQSAAEASAEAPEPVDCCHHGAVSTQESSSSPTT